MSDLTAMPSARWCGWVLFAWLTLRTLAWLAAIVASHPNGPLDLIEWLSWGHSIQWGYPKHPPLPAWLATSFARLSPGDVWGVYLLGYLSAAGCIVAAYRLGQRYLPAPLALGAALSLEGLMYLTNDPAEWSNNVALSLGWAWTIVLGEKAVRTNSLGAWAAVGTVIGLTLLCKYTLGVLLLPMIAYLLWSPRARRCLRSSGPYLAMLVALAVFTPHLVWVIQHDFVTVKYAVERSDSSDPLGRLIHPLAFLGGQLIWLLPVGIVLLPWLPIRWIRRHETSESVSPQPPSADPQFLHFVVLGPVVVLLLLSVTTGCQLREIWGSPLWTFFGVWTLVVGRAKWNRMALRRGLWAAAVVGLAFLAFTVTKQVSYPYLSGKTHRPHFPGRQLAAEVLVRWQTKFPNSEPFSIVAGEGWTAGNVCCYATHRPVLFSSGVMGALEFDPVLSPWTSDQDLIQRGGVIVWDARQLGDTLPKAVASRFPSAIGEPVIELSYRTGADIPPVRIGLALVPPSP